MRPRRGSGDWPGGGVMSVGGVVALPPGNGVTTGVPGARVGVAAARVADEPPPPQAEASAPVAAAPRAARMLRRERRVDMGAPVARSEGVYSRNPVGIGE